MTDKYGLDEWAKTDLAQSLIVEEQTQLAPMLRRLYGPVTVQLGSSGFSDYAEGTGTLRHVFGGNRWTDELATMAGVGLVCDEEDMPFDAKSVNVLLLPHVLEFSPDPHQVLREASRVLVPEGHLVLTGFNPYSIWGVRSGLSGLSKDAAFPWCGRFIPLHRIKDWLSVLGFEIISGASAYYLPPIRSARVRTRLGFLNTAGARWWPMCAALFIVVARKREIGMTPIVPGWIRKNALAPGLAEPVVKNG